jgi:two-component system CheB/CheR fusion protein
MKTPGPKKIPLGKASPNKVRYKSRIKNRLGPRRPNLADPTEKPGNQVQQETGSPQAGTPKRFPIVGIGASAGGLEAFTQFLQNLPTDTGMGFVLVQHLDPAHASALTQLLSRATSLPVREVTNDLLVEPNHVYIIAPNTTLGMAQGVLKLKPREAGHGAHRSIDFFLESLAHDQGECAIGVILSGTASDGTLGLEAIKAEGGITFAQDESAKYDSMPHSAIAAGCVDFVLPPNNIAKELARIAKHPFVAGAAQSEPVAQETAHSVPSEGVMGDEDGFKKILALLRNHSPVDFSLYKTTTIQRRITRRMVLNKLTTLDAYAQFLRGKPKELDALYSDVLISVTSFFRNPEAFDLLKRKVFPKILPERRDEPLRVWVLGCSTGQEVYSLAMSLTEFFDDIPRAPKLQIFASDLNEALLAKARAGLYAKSVLQGDVSPERLRRFFVEEDGGYRVVKPLREAVVFARQNLLSDPPFSRMDLVSCRNLLIYLDAGLQKTVMPTFHYALKPKGCLFLGASETIGTFTNLFEQVDKKHKIYFKKPGPSPPLHLQRAQKQVAAGKQLSVSKSTEATEVVRVEPKAQREADRLTRNRYAPPSVLVNAEWHVLEFRGHTSPYLEPPTGQANFNVLKMAREGLMLPLRAALNKAKKENKVVRRENVRVNQNGQNRTANFEVMPLKNLKERCYLIFFEDSAEQKAAPAVPSGATSLRSTAKEQSRRVKELETELAETRDYLQSVEEQHKSANEVVQSSNEEVTSANEELQSINEELETSKEELESTNEELTTVNDEMVNRNTELNRLNNDLTNLQTSAKLAIVVLRRDLSIRRFSAQAEKQFNLLATDVGRPINNVRHNLVFLERGLDPTLAFPVGQPDGGGALKSQKTGEAPSPVIVGRVEASKLQPRVAEPVARPAGTDACFPEAGEYRGDLESLIAQVIATVSEHECEVRDNEGRWYSLRISPYMTLDNKVDGAVLVLMHIDALKQKEREITEARKYAESAVETVRESLVVLDSELCIESANQSFFRTFHVEPAESIGKSIFDLGNRQWDIPRLRTLLEELLPQNSSFENFEIEHEFPLIGQRTMLLNARRIHTPAGKTQRILLAIEDLTEARKLTNRASQLEQAVSERTAELTATNKQLEAFVYTVAHDLRAPLRAMQGFSAVLVEESGAALSETGRDFAARINRAALFMDALLADLLTFSRVSQQRMDLISVNLEAVVQSVLFRLEKEIQEKNAKMEILAPWPTVLGHETMLGQVVFNLVSNALKFATLNVQPLIRLRTEEYDGLIRVWVEDNGIGIAPEHQEQIFRPFMRLNGESYGGTGIGLAIVQKGVERMGGRVGLESTPGQGSRFWFELPKS